MMANFRAINATCYAVPRLLEQNFDKAQFNNTNMTFDVYGTDDFKSTPIKNGVSLYLYRVHVNTSQRIPPGRNNPDGTKQREKLPVDLSILLTAWAEKPSMQLTVLGWMMRVLEDYPILNAGLLNTATSTVFANDEKVELIVGHISTEDLLRIWDTIPGDYQISVPYVVRVLRIETDLLENQGEAVLTRDLGYGSLQS